MNIRNCSGKFIRVIYKDIYHEGRGSREFVIFLNTNTGTATKLSCLALLKISF